MPAVVVRQQYDFWQLEFDVRGAAESMSATDRAQYADEIALVRLPRQFPPAAGNCLSHGGYRWVIVSVQAATKAVGDRRAGVVPTLFLKIEVKK
jgi:hypothetical protein